MFNDVEELEFLLQHPFIGGDGEGEGDQGGGQTTVEEGSDEAQHSGDRSNGQQQHSQTVPYDRFSQVNREKQELAKQVEAYKKYGTVQDIERAIQRAKDGGVRFTKAEQDSLDADLLAGSKSHKENTEFIKELRERETQAVKSFREDAAPARVSTLIKGLGVQWKNDQDRVSKERHAQSLIAEEIRTNQTYMQRWMNRDMSVVDDVWKVVKPYFDHFRRTQNATIQAGKLQNSKVGSDGKAPVGSQKDSNGYPMTADGRIDERAVLARASEKGFSRLKASEE